MIETELCAFSTEACRIAARNGVTRVELCTSPYEGGTTPSAAAIRAARRIEGLQLSVMIRPRGGDFLYTDEEFEQMLEEVRFARAAAPTASWRVCSLPTAASTNTARRSSSRRPAPWR